MKLFRVPIGLYIATVVCFILGAVAAPIIQNSATEEQLARNVILNAVPFILTFVGILLVFFILVWAVAAALNNNISPQLYRPIELVIVSGIILGTLGMFQPWWFALFRPGFFLLLGSTLAFILWSHISPRNEEIESS